MAVTSTTVGAALIRVGKPLVIFLFSALWLIVSLIRVPDRIGSRADIGIDANWVISLAETLQHHSLSGRDFHFTYGPLAQVLAWTGARLHSPWSAVDSLPLILLAFYASAVLLFALILLLVEPLDWRNCIFIYVGAAGLNLFSEPTSFRPLALMLCAVCFYRGLECRSGKRVVWAAATGVLCCAAQLLTFELGVYGMATVLVVGAASAVVDRHGARWTIIRLSGFALTSFLVANILATLVLGPSYLKYGFEVSAGFLYTAGVPWGLPAGQTMALLIVAVATMLAAYFTGRRLGDSRRVMLLALVVCGVIQLKSATIRSDVGHITQASSPLVFVFLLIGSWFATSWHRARAPLVLWGAAFSVLWFSWPWAGSYAFTDMVRAATTASPFSKFAALRTNHARPEEVLPQGLAAVMDKSSGPLLVFPYENYVALELQRPLVAPALMSYNASTEELQRFYVARLDQEEELEIVYGLDDVASPTIDAVQAISRVPLIFEYLLRHFRLRASSSFDPGFYLLQRDEASHREFGRRDLRSESRDLEPGVLEIDLPEPAACSLVELAIEMDYSWMRYFGRPSPIEVTFSRSGAPFLRTGIYAIKPNAPFSTFVSLLPKEQMYEVFGPGPVIPTSWDSIRVAPRSSDWLGVTPSVKVRRITCLQ